MFQPAHFDLQEVKELLDSCALPSTDISDRHLSHFIAAREANKIVGAVGLEPLGSVALLRF